MEAAPAGVTALNPSGTAGVTTVPVSYLVPQAIPNDAGTGNSYMPGLAAICKSQTLYTAQLASPSEVICTQTNQCGCTPADFTTLLSTDSLLNSPGTTSPLEADGSGASVCGQNPVPAGSDCRYVIVPIEAGSTTPLIESLSGSQANAYTQTDATNSTVTTGKSNSYSTGFSFGGGILLASVTTTDTWNWTDYQSVGSSTGQANSLALTLKTSTAACQEDVNIYEDTIFHTFTFQVPTGITSCP